MKTIKVNNSLVTVSVEDTKYASSKNIIVNGNGYEETLLVNYFAHGELVIGYSEARLKNFNIVTDENDYINEHMKYRRNSGLLTDLLWCNNQGLELYNNLEYFEGKGFVLQLTLGDGVLFATIEKDVADVSVTLWDNNPWIVDNTTTTETMDLFTTSVETKAPLETPMITTEVVLTDVERSIGLKFMQSIEAEEVSWNGNAYEVDSSEHFNNHLTPREKMSSFKFLLEYCANLAHNGIVDLCETWIGGYDWELLDKDHLYRQTLKFRSLGDSVMEKVILGIQPGEIMESLNLTNEGYRVKQLLENLSCGEITREYYEEQIFIMLSKN